MLDVLQNRSEGPARVMEVAPLEADGLSLAGWYLIDPEAEAPTVGPGFVDRSADEDDIVAPGSRAVLARAYASPARQPAFRAGWR